MTTPELELNLRATIRTIPDYPSPGIMFRDITTLLSNARAFRLLSSIVGHQFQSSRLRPLFYSDGSPLFPPGGKGLA